MRLLLFTFLLSALSFGQDRNGISYQALIINPNVEQLPGQDNDHSPLTNTDICLQFHIINSSGNYEYSESQSVTTDSYGMVNLVIGTGLPIGAITWEAVAWSAEAKSLKVDLDITGACTSFTELSNQELTSVPFALYSPSSNVPGPKGDPGDPGTDGDSAYQVWLDEGNTGTEQEFLDSLKGTDGTPGADGDSAYQVWLDTGNTGTEQEFLDSLKGADGDPGEGTEGKSAYDIWIELGNTGSEQDFIDSLVGPQGEPGQDGTGNSNSGLANAISSSEVQINYFEGIGIFRGINNWATTTSYSSNFYTTTRGIEIDIYDYDLNKVGTSINIDNIEFPLEYNKFNFKYFGGVNGISSDGKSFISTLTMNDDKQFFVFVVLENNRWLADKIIQKPNNEWQIRFNSDFSKYLSIYQSDNSISVRSYDLNTTTDSFVLNDEYNLPITNSYKFYINDNLSKIIVSGFNSSGLNLQTLSVSNSFKINKLFDYEIPHSFIPYDQDKVDINSLSMNSDGSMLAVIIGVRTENWPSTIREYEAIIYNVQTTTLVKKMSWDMPSYNGGNTNQLMASPQMILNETGDKLFFSDSSSTTGEGGLWNVYDISTSDFVPLGGERYSNTIQYHNHGGTFYQPDNWRRSLIFGEKRYGVLLIKKLE